MENETATSPSPPTHCSAVCADRIAAAEAQGWSGPWRFGNEHLHGTPPSGTRKCHDGDHVPEDVDKLVVRLHQQIRVLSSGIAAVRDLIDESQGVVGLHHNGDAAPWSELQTGGRFEEWLVDFDAAVAICQPNVRSEEPE